MPFVHLHNHSQYSLLDALMSTQALAACAKKHHMPAVAITDHMNLFGIVDFYKQCKELGVKPIIGCEMYLAPESRFEKKRLSNLPNAFHLTLLCKNKTGYHNLCKLTSSGYTEGFYYVPRIDFELLSRHHEGLICLSGCKNSELAFHILKGSSAAFEETLCRYQTLFKDDLYLELQRHTMTAEDMQLDNMQDEPWLYQQYQDYTQAQEKVNIRLLQAAQEHAIPYVATNNCHYSEREDWKAHEILINVQSGEPCQVWERDVNGEPRFRTPNPKRTTFPSHEFFFKSEEEMQVLFHDLPQALEESVRIAERCELEMDFKTKHYPVYVPPHLKAKAYTQEERLKSVEEYLMQLCIDAIPIRYTPERLAKVAEKYPSQDPATVVKQRLDYEMNIITSKGMSDYLLIVWDFIHWAKKNGIPMGPGRGSGAGSIILYLTGITDIEPLRFNLFFERFINPERISYPDIDVDICMDRRNDVISYTIDTYGKDNVAQIVTFGTMKAKMSVKDVGRVLSVPLSKVNHIAKLIPEDLNITIEKALEKDPDLKKVYETDEEARQLLDLAKKLEGSIRNTGIHAAGMIVSGTPLTDHIPVCNAKDSPMLVTQFSMKPVEMVGMLKIDFLGLKTLTCIQMCCNAIRQNKNIDVNWVDLPLEDTLTFELLNQGRTQGVFQLESGGMQDLAKQLHLDRFEEIIAVLSLYRPGPMDMIPSFIQRKHGKEAIESDHPWMEEILAETYGIMVYQEQVMQIASKLANYSLGEGDVLRRAMGKKDMREMAKQREKFTQGALKNGISEEVANRIFDKMEKFAEYGFNKSHAAAYGYLTYVTAYLKAHHPGEWLAALMTCDKDDIEKVAKFINEGQQSGIQTLPPHVNESLSHFAATSQGIRFALGAIKGVGSNVVDAIVEERTKRGPYSSLYDFISRIDTKRVGKKVIELLVESGAFDFTKWKRDELKASVDQMFEETLRSQKEKAAGVLSLFANIQSQAAHTSTPPKLARLRSADELLLREKELLGLFLTGHPLDTFKELMQQLGGIPLSKLETLDYGAVFRSAFIIESVTTRFSSKSNKKFAILTVSDGTVGEDGKSRFELPIWPELYEEKGLLLIENRMIWAVLSKEKREQSTQLSCRWLCDLKTISDKEIKDSEIAYDKAKLAAKARAAYSSNPNKSAKKPLSTSSAISTAAPQKMILRFDLDKLRFSHILYLKNILQSMPGPQPLEIRFTQGDQENATLHLNANFFISDDNNILEQLSTLSSFNNN